MVINKTGQELSSSVNFRNALPGTTARLYQYSAADTSKIVALPNRTVIPAPVCATCPPYAVMSGSYAANSITTVVIDGSGPSPSPSVSVSPSRSASGSPSGSPSRSVSLSPSASRSSSPSSSAPAGPACTATYKVTNQWSGGFQGDVTVTNTGRTATKRWTVTWTFANGQEVTQTWNATLTQAGAAVTANSVSWNATVAPGR